MEEILRDLGFESKQEWSRLVSSVNLSTKKYRDLFSDWNENDGTKEGLLNLIEIIDMQRGVIGLENRRVDLYRFTDGKSSVNIYIEETAPNQGRFILVAGKIMAHRYFDGCGGSLKRFLVNSNPTSIGLNIGIEKASERIKVIFLLDLIWPLFTKRLNEVMSK